MVPPPASTPLISKWLDENLLTLNCAKSKFLVFGSNRRLKTFTNVSIHVNNQQLARQQTFRYLGITFSENLNWSDPLTDVSTKINQRIGLLRRVKAFLSVKDRLTNYNSLILPLFDYADIICRDESKALIGGGGAYSYIRVLPDEFLLKSTVMTTDFKRNSSGRTRIYEYTPPPQLTL